MINIIIYIIVVICFVSLAYKFLMMKISNDVNHHNLLKEKEKNKELICKIKEYEIRLDHYEKKHDEYYEDD
jgi:hypothetical protein